MKNYQPLKEVASAAKALPSLQASLAPIVGNATKLGTNIQRAQGVDNANDTFITDIVEFTKELFAAFYWFLKNEVFMSSALVQASKKSTLLSSAFLSKQAAGSGFFSTIGRLIARASGLIRRAGAMTLLRIIGKSWYRWFARHILRFVPWAWVGMVLWESITTIYNSMKGVDIIDTSTGEWRLAWKNIAVAGPNPCGPGTACWNKKIKSGDYSGSYDAASWAEWPKAVQINFCKENNRLPLLASGDFAPGPGCEEIGAWKGEEEFASFPEGTEGVAMSTEDGEVYVVSNDSDGEEYAESISENKKITLRVIKERKILAVRKLTEQSDFIPSSKVYDEAIKMIRKHGKGKIGSKVAQEIFEKIKKTLTHGGLLDHPVGIRRQDLEQAVAGLVSKNSSQ